MKNHTSWLLVPAVFFAACRTQSTDQAANDSPLGGLTVSASEHKLNKPALPAEAGMDAAYVFDNDAVLTPAVSDSEGVSYADTQSGQALIARLPRITAKLRAALQGQRRLLRRQDLTKVYSYNGQNLTTQDFIDVIEGLLAEGVDAYAPVALSVAKRNEVEFTAYYSPDIAASRVRTERFAYPILKLPASSEARTATRAQIESGSLLDIDAHALAWVAHPMDVYILQLQGSGYVTFPDGERVYLAYAKSNGRKFQSIKSAVATVEPDVARKGVKGIRKWMSEDLATRGKLVALCDNYVFFRSRPTAPTGSAGVALTPMVSVAADPQHYPPGAVLLAEVPVPGKSRIREARILLVQDTGAAIKGARRLDLYTGVGAKALDIARLTSHIGEVYVLAPNKLAAPGGS